MDEKTRELIKKIQEEDAKEIRKQWKPRTHVQLMSAARGSIAAESCLPTSLHPSSLTPSFPSIPPSFPSLPPSLPSFVHPSIKS